MTDRGEYRAVRRVLLDGPDFQQLPERARWLFVALKLNLGPAGIEVWYPAELVARMAAQTGMPSAGVESALAVLERGGWIEREANVIWIVGQLENDPHVKQADKKHRTMVQRHVDGLPRLPIVARFVMAHHDWFTADGTPSGGPSSSLTWALEGPKKGHRSTENKPEPENKPEDESIAPIHGANGIAPRSTWLTPYCDAWKARYGGEMPVGPAAKALAPVRKQHGDEETVRRWSIYLALTDGQFASPARFASTWAQWAEPPNRTTLRIPPPTAADKMTASMHRIFTPSES